MLNLERILFRRHQKRDLKKLAQNSTVFSLLAYSQVHILRCQSKKISVIDKNPIKNCPYNSIWNYLATSWYWLYYDIRCNVPPSSLPKYGVFFCLVVKRRTSLSQTILDQITPIFYASENFLSKFVEIIESPSHIFTSQLLLSSGTILVGNYLFAILTLKTQESKSEDRKNVVSFTLLFTISVYLLMYSIH